MMPRLIVHERAVDDVTEIANFIAEQHLGAALRFMTPLKLPSRSSQRIPAPVQRLTRHYPRTRPCAIGR